MRWASFTVAGRSAYGMVTADEGLIDVAALEPGLPTLRAVIAAGMLGPLASRHGGRPADFGCAAVTFLPVIPDAGKIFCIGLNYRAHQEETGREATAQPTVFVRFNESQTGHGLPLIKPRESAAFDWEGEIALVIGTGGRRIPRADALRHVAGYAPFNDGSVRDWQRHTTQFTPGKNFFASGSFGPWMMTADEVGDPDAMELTTRLNGEVMQHTSAALLIFGFAELIEYISTFTVLNPGDVIVTGTPGGVGAARKPPLYMKAGDVVEVEVKPVGTLVNPVIEG